MISGLVCLAVDDIELSVYVDTRQGDMRRCDYCGSPHGQMHLVEITEMLRDGVKLDGRSAIYRRAVNQAKELLLHGKSACSKCGPIFDEEQHRAAMRAEDEGLPAR